MWVYPPELREALGGLGFAPRPDTPPARVRAAVDDLYRYELRRVRDRLLRGAVPRQHYAELVIALRKKYWILTLPESAWDRVCADPGSDAGR